MGSKPYQHVEPRELINAAARSVQKGATREQALRGLAGLHRRDRAEGERMIDAALEDVRRIQSYGAEPVVVEGL